ncbi:outer membrane protein [Helicobacter ailurogastricus]|uniref:outer membrane protein n=1 Tax=Helicobacter ailurogastricus TaxID=1578720 RepID=UPI002490E327|nr:outer membrane protein [Helicobacter ailurogastricus]
MSAQSANTTTTTTGSAGDASTNTTSTNTTTAYPMAGPNASATSGGTTTVTSWITTRISNQATYNTAYNKALGQLLGYAMSYNTNSTALGKMLSSSVSLSNILTQGINDAAANVMFNGGATNATNTADDINNQAQQLNNIKAIFQSEDLLNSYVGAITQNYSNSPISVQQAQASALDYLYNALSAGTAQNGLIAQTKEAIANALNNNLVASNLPAQALQIVNSISPSLFQPNLTTQQMVAGLSDLSSTFTSYLDSVTGTSSLSTVMTGLQSLSTVATGLQTLQNLASSVGHAINIPEILTQVIGNGTAAVAPESSAAFSTAFDGTSVKATALSILTNLVGAANSTTATTTDAFKSSPLGKLIAALNASTGNGVAVNNAATTTPNLKTIVDAVPKIVSGLQKAETNGLNLTELEALATGSAAQKADAVKYISDISDLPKQIGYATGVSARQNFLDGKLTVADISNQIQALKAQIASYENMDTNSTGKAGLNIGLSSMLGTSISSVQNLGFANAAVNTLKTQLAQALPLLVGGESANFNISTVQGLVADLNKAVGALYSGTNGNIFFNNGEMQTVSNMNNNTVNVSPNTFGLGGGGGVPANANNGGSPHYYNNELTNLANLNTINSLLSGGILTSNAISTSYNGAFGAQTAGNYGFAGQIATAATYGSGSNVSAYTALTNNLASGVTLADVVDALLPIGQELAAGTITSNTAKTDAITALTPLITTPATNAQYVWAAYSAVMGLGASGTSAVAGLNNLLSSKQDLSTVAGITTVLQDANSLVSANKALTSTMGDLNGSQVLTVASGNVPNTAENLNNAIAAATALGNLLKQINPADLTNPIGGANTAVGSATTVINAINSYNHNVQLLNNLTNGNGAKIAGDVIAYLQGNTSYNSLTGNSVTNTAINNLQNLLNRYEYLQGLQSQVQAAIANNPYALIMQQNQVLKSDGYQEAAKALVSTTGVGPGTGGLFNVAVSSTISPGASSTFDLNNTAFTSLASTVGNDIANAQNWNAYFTNLMSPSNSILSTPTSGAGTEASGYLNTIAGSIYNLAGYFTPASVSNNKVVTTNLQSNIDSALGAYSAINTAIGQLTTSTPLNISANLTLSNLTTAGAGSGFNTTAATGATDMANLTFLDVAQSIVDISGMLTPKDSQTNGIVGNQALIDSIQGVMGDSTGSTTTIQGTAGQLAAIFKQGAGTGVTPFDMSNNLPTSIPTISGGDVSVAASTPADTITSMSKASVAIVSGIVQAIENNSTLQGFLANPSSFTAGTNDANIIALQNTIAKYVGGDAQTYSGGSLTGGSGNAAVLNSAGIAKQFLTNLNKFVGQGGALQSLNSNFKPSVRAGVANFNSPAFVSNVEKMLNNALDWSTNYDNALRAVKPVAGGTTYTLASGGGAGTAGTITSATIYNAIASIAKNADTLFNNDALTANATNNGGALATATQALSQFALANGVNGASPDTNRVPATAAGAGTLAGLMAYYLYQDLKTSYPNLDGAPIAAVISAATPAQLAAAATQVLGSTQFKGSTAMQQNLINTTLSNMLTQAKDYTNAAVGTTAGAAGGLSGLLNSKTTIQDVLQTAIANAASMHNLNGVLNPNNNDRVSVSKGQLSTTSINTINKLLGAMTAANGNLPTINPNTPVGAEAKMLLAMVAANNAATNALGLLSATGGATSGSAQTYFQNVTTFINDQATLLAKQNSTVVQLLEGMTQAVANSTSTDQQAQSAFGALKAVYTQIASPTINYTSAMNNLIGVIHQLENLQQSLVDQLAANQGQPGVNTASVDGLGTLVAKVQAEQKGFSDPNSLTPQQVQAATKLLNQIQSALTYAKAAQLKMSQMLASRGVMTAYAASHMPMQTMNSNGNMYGIDVQFGYKQFFGKKKRWGVRYYANFSYQHGTFMTSDASELDNFVYGAGVDALYNFYESKDGKYTSGLFAGLMLEGSSWAVKGQSYYDSLVAQGLGKMNTSYFQIPINLGFRTNVNKHNGFEIGLRIPLATNYYYKGLNEFGDKLDIAYKRNVSVFFNYVYNF